MYQRQHVTFYSEQVQFIKTKQLTKPLRYNLNQTDNNANIIMYSVH